MQRLRMYRKDAATREKYAEVSLAVSDFIYPYFVVAGEQIRREIPSLRGIYHFSIDQLIPDIKDAVRLGINKVLLFGVIDESLKDEQATAAYEENNLIARAVEAIKKACPSVTIMTDVCLCGYTNHGHCGIAQKRMQRINLPDDFCVVNDETLPLLAHMALTHARAGADFVAPSAMMDLQVRAIREYLNIHGFTRTRILSYAVKYASSFYGPFRDAARSAPAFGDRRTYQMDYRTVQQALEEVEADLAEGADWIMIKPAYTYLDIIYRVQQNFFPITLVAYQVSGEYMMIHAAADAGYLDRDRAMQEALMAIKRAGAEYIVSYYAKEYAKKVYSIPEKIYAKK